MMERRAFFGRLAAVGAAPLLGLLPLAPRGEEYVPVGHLDADHILAQEVDYATVNGTRVESTHLIESHDVEGWLIHVLDGSPRSRFVRETGTVRIHWKPL